MAIQFLLTRCTHPHWGVYGLLFIIEPDPLWGVVHELKKIVYVLIIACYSSFRLSYCLINENIFFIDVKANIDIYAVMVLDHNR